jgi:hypothetical protein
MYVGVQKEQRELASVRETDSCPTPSNLAVCPLTLRQSNCDDRPRQYGRVLVAHSYTTSEQFKSLQQSYNRPLLSKLTEPQRELLLALAEEITFEQDQVVLHVGEGSQHFYLLTSGSVGVDVVTRYYKVRVQALGPGDAFGWSSLLEGCDTFFEVRACERSTALRFRGDRLTALCRENPNFGVEFLRGVLHTVAGRVLGAEMRLAEFCGVSERTS